MLALIMANGLVSRRRREPLVAATQRVFAAGAGNRLLNLAMALSLVGWFSFYVGIAGFSLATLLGIPGWSGALLLAAALLGLSHLGLNRWNVLVWLTALAALAAALVALRVVPAGGDVPQPAAPTWALYIGAVGSVIAYSSVFSVRCGDFTWNLARDRDLLWTAIGFYVPLVAALGIGIVLYRQTGEANLANILARSEAATLGHIFLILSVASPALSNIFSGVRNIAALLPLPLSWSAAGIAALGAVLGGLRFDLQLVTFLEWTGVVLPSVVAVLVLTALLPRKIAPAAATAAWLSGAGVAILLRALDRPVYVLAGLLVTTLVLLGLQWRR
jgi:hypothetical protein